MTTEQCCFILMPFGRKADVTGRIINFDSVYEDFIKRAVDESGLLSIRADEELFGGFIQKTMFERLIFSDFAIADLTSSNANVFYELGVRHTACSGRTILLCAEGTIMPIDVQGLKFISYPLTKTGKPANINTICTTLCRYLESNKVSYVTDSPVFQLVKEWRRPEVDKSSKLQVESSFIKTEELKLKIENARKEGIESLRYIAAELLKIKDFEPSILLYLFFSYRNLNSPADQVDLVSKMNESLANLSIVQEQYALALSKVGRLREAEEILSSLIKNRPSSESFAIFGRVYKERWQNALKEGYLEFIAEGYLRKAIEMYTRGFEHDWRDVYPGINAVSLMEQTFPVDSRQKELLPVVKYASKRNIAARIETGEVDYWDWANLVEIAVLLNDREMAASVLPDCLAAVRAAWEPVTTARNIRQIRDTREKEGQRQPWIEEIEEILLTGTTQGEISKIDYIHPRLQARINNLKSNDDER